MGRRSLKGVRPKGSDRIEFEFIYKGKRYRPSLARIPTEANLRRALLQLKEIKLRIQYGTFDFKEEFPDYRMADAPAAEKLPKPIEGSVLDQHPRSVNSKLPPKPKRSERTCNEVFDAFLRHCDMRVANGDMAYSTANGYRKLLGGNWRPTLGKHLFLSVVFSDLAELASKQGWNTKKTYNNGISAVRCAFEFGYKDHPKKTNPAAGLESFRILKRDRPKVDPFTIQEAEWLIDGIHRDWGEAIGNFDEFRMFTGLRQSEQISLRIGDCDLTRGTILIHQVVVLGRHKDRPKNNEERTVELCPRALSVLRRQWVLREQLMAEGKVHHDYVFLKDDGEPISSLQYVYGRWCSTIDRLAIRYRAPYNARHSCVSWHLMIGKNLLWCSTQFGHSVQVMLCNYGRWISGYGRWISGATEEDIRLIREAITSEAIRARVESPASPSEPQNNATETPLGKGWGRLSWRKVKYFNNLTGGADGTRTRDPRRDRPVF